MSRGNLPPEPNTIKPPRKRFTRRQWIQLAVTGAATLAGLGFYVHYIEPHWVEVVHRSLPVANLPDAWIGRRVVQISDIHTGARVSSEYLQRCFDLVRALSPDLVLITGDFIDCKGGTVPPMGDVFAKIPRGTTGTFAVLGNHDYGENWLQAEVAQAVADKAQECDIHVLRNEMENVAGLHIVGLDDWMAQRFDAAPVLSQITADAPTLVLSHNPDTADLPVWQNYNGWILCGHTHGGQCRPPFLPPPLLPVQNQRYTAGEFALSGNRKMYINRGLGHLLQARFCVRPEITVFRLQRAATSSPTAT